MSALDVDGWGSLQKQPLGSFQFYVPPFVLCNFFFIFLFCGIRRPVGPILKADDGHAYLVPVTHDKAEGRTLRRTCPIHTYMVLLNISFLHVPDSFHLRIKDLLGFNKIKVKHENTLKNTINRASTIKILRCEIILFQIAFTSLSVNINSSSAIKFVTLKSMIKGDRQKMAVLRT